MFANFLLSCIKRFLFCIKRSRSTHSWFPTAAFKPNTDTWETSFTLSCGFSAGVHGKYRRTIWEINHGRAVSTSRATTKGCSLYISQQAQDRESKTQGLGVGGNLYFTAREERTVSVCRLFLPLFYMVCIVYSAYLYFTMYLPCLSERRVPLLWSWWKKPGQEASTQVLGLMWWKKVLFLNADIFLLS